MILALFRVYPTEFDLCTDCLLALLSLYIESPNSMKSSPSSSAGPPDQAALFLNIVFMISPISSVSPVVGSDGSVRGVLHHHPGVVPDPVLPPVLVPGVVHSEPAPVSRIGFVLPGHYT